MARKTRKQKILRSERKQTTNTPSVSTSAILEPTLQHTKLTEEEKLTNTYFKADFNKSFLIIIAIIAAEVLLYYTDFASRLLGK
jgi:hypothetical protein